MCTFLSNKLYFFSHSTLDNNELKNFKLQYLLHPMHHYRAKNLKFSKMHKKALTFKACKRILIEFMWNLQLFSSILGNFGDHSYLQVLSIKFWCKILKLYLVKKGINSLLCMKKVKQKINVSLCISMGLSTWILVTLWHFTPWQNWL